MKKIFLFCAAAMAAMSINAQDPISVTCAEAAAAMPAQSDSETEDVYIVTGYVTNTNGSINSSHQQSFYMDDEKGTKKTFQGYLAYLPEGENTPLAIGDLVALTGKIKNYNGNPEIEKGNVVILERSTTQIDTIDVTVCEALEEGASLNDKDYSTDVFRVFGRVKGTETINQYGAHTFEMACGDEVFKPYNCTADEGATFGKGDSVVVIGKLYNYGGVIEISGGRVELIQKSGEEETITEVSVAEAIAIAMALENGKSTDDRYAVTGYVDSIAIAYSEQYNNISFFMCDDKTNPTYDFEAYRVVCTADQAADLVGRKVTVTAALQHYYKAATETLPEIDLAETVAGGELVIIWGEGVENINAGENAIKRIENGQVVIIRNNVKYNALGIEVK